MWALDLGTTNTLIARWNADADRPQLLELPGLRRLPAHPEAVDQKNAVPSAVQVIERPSWWAKTLGLGRLAYIGQSAVDLNRVLPRPSFVSGFKRELARSPLQHIARVRERPVSAREVARLYLRELFREAKAASGERVRDLVITSPVEAFETYRAEVSALAKAEGVRRVRFLDEPVAAAVGYGLGLSRERRVLVADFGGGTFHLALVHLRAGDVKHGRGEVLAKAGRNVGGDSVDQWVLEEVCRELDVDLREDTRDEGRVWRQLMLTEACRVKESVFFDQRASFDMIPPEHYRGVQGRIRGTHERVEFDRDRLTKVLTDHGLYGTLEDATSEVIAAAHSRGIQEQDIEDVLMVGGSTLLPGVFAFFEQRFGRDRVRAWQPFEAVAYGACVFAAGRIEPADFIVHDYALVTYDLKSQEPQFTIIVPRGTRFPTEPALWRRELVPTCALGEPERVFKLVVCEVGQADEARRFGWDTGGRLHKLANGAAMVVKLNETNPALGRLDPPHSPSDKRPRLDLSFGVNADRWLCATAIDLMTGKYLMRAEPVVRLL